MTTDTTKEQQGTAGATPPANPPSNAPKPQDGAPESNPAGQKVEAKPIVITKPEGFEIDDGVLGVFGKTAQELQLSQKQAQELVEKVLPEFANVERRRGEQWQAEALADKEIGGDKMEQTLQLSKKALDAYADDGLMQLLRGPIGNHPSLLRMLAKIGRTVSEDGPGADQGGGPPSKLDLNDTAQVASAMFPKSIKK